MSDQPAHDDASNGTGPAGDSGQPGGPGDYATLGGPPRPAGRSRGMAIGAVVAAVAMLGGAGAAYAVRGSAPPQRTVPASSPKSPSPSPAPWKCPNKAMCSHLHVPPFRRGGLLPGLPFARGMLGAVHGQVVVPKRDGGYQTVDLQRGKVTAVSTGSITVRSADGFRATYVVAGATIVGAQRAGIGSIKVGDQVALQATVSGSKATATRIIDLTLLSKNHGPASFRWSLPSG